MVWTFLVLPRDLEESILVYRVYATFTNNGHATDVYAIDISLNVKVCIL